MIDRNFHIGHFGTDALTPFTNVLKRIQVETFGCLYRGNGVLTWVPGEGFSIFGSMRLIRGARPSEWELGRPTFPTGKLNSLRLEAGNGDKAIAFVDSPRFDSLLSGNELHIELNALHFLSRSDGRQADVAGRLLFQGEYPIGLPDMINTLTKVNGKQLKADWHRGLSYERDGVGFYIDHVDKNIYAIDWWCSDACPAGLSPRRWSIGLVHAWQFLIGQGIAPIVIDLDERNRHVRLISKREEVVHLHAFSLRKQHGSFSGEDLVKLATLFGQDSVHATIAKELLFRSFDAADARTWHTRMFLIGAGLEGALRTEFGTPFVPKGSGPVPHFPVCERLREFISKHFSDRWDSVFDHVAGAWDRTRHRAAHPDWIQAGVDDASSLPQKEFFNDLVTLSWFYGYMILAMAGYDDLEPSFPRPVDEWKPAVHVTRHGANDAQD